MTRLFLFAALAASALATMDSSYDNKQDYSKGNDYSGDNKMQQSGYNPQNKDVQSGYNPPNKDMQGGYNQGDDKSKDDNNKGNDYKGNDYKGNDYKGGDNGGNNGGDVNIKVNVNIKIISIYAGGNNAVQQVAPPAMNAGQTHEVGTVSYRRLIVSNADLFPPGHSWR